MTIAAELDRIISAKNDILSAINDKGVSTAGTTSISQCPALINAIQTGGGGNTLINSGITGKAVFSGSGAFKFTQIPIGSYGISSISGESGFLSSRTATRSAYKYAAIVFDSAIRILSSFSATGIPNYTAGSAALILSVRSSNTTNTVSAAIYNQAINSTNSALISASASDSVLSSINSALSANTSRRLYLFTAVSAATTQSAALNTGYTANTANISADATIVTGTSLPYPDEPESASGYLHVTSTAYETVYGVLTATASSTSIFLPASYTASAYGASGRCVSKLSGYDTLTVSSQAYTGCTPGFALFNAQQTASGYIGDSAIAARVYSSIYPSANYTYSSLILPPPMTSLVSQDII